MEMKRNQRGFTLMELMVVIVIVAILAAVAVPLYINYVKDAQRTEAKGAIGAIISAEQVYFQKPENQHYFGPAADAAAIESGLGIDLTEAKVNWTFAISGGDVDGFTVTATGKGDKPSKNLGVTYTHSRSGKPDAGWSDNDPNTAPTP